MQSLTALSSMQYLSLTGNKLNLLPVNEGQIAAICPTGFMRQPVNSIYKYILLLYKYINSSDVMIGCRSQHPH